MWTWLRRWLGRSDSAVVADQAVAAREVAAPDLAVPETPAADVVVATEVSQGIEGVEGVETLQMPQTMAREAVASGGGRSFVRRYPVLGRDERIAGYLFGLPEKLQQRAQEAAADLRRSYDDVLLRSLVGLNDAAMNPDQEALLGQRLAFVQLSEAALDHPLLTRLPREHTVLILSPVAGAGGPSPRLEARLAQLHEQGYAWGWSLRRTLLAEAGAAAWLALAGQGDHVQIEFSGFDGMEIRTLLKTLANRPDGQEAAIGTAPEMGRALKAGSRPYLMASQLASHDEFRLCCKSGFDFFAGGFVRHFEGWQPPKTDINRLHVLEMLNLLRSGEDSRIIAERLGRDPVLTFKMLRYLNSPALGLLTAVNSIDKALTILGRERFYRWLSLLLFDVKAPGFRERLLTEQALSRARFLESLAGLGRIPARKDALFIMGLFSMLDLLLGQPLETVLQQTQLEAGIHDALLGRPGLLGEALQLAMAVEEADEEALERLAQRCGLEAAQVTRCSVAALAWAHEVSSAQDRPT